MVYVQEKRQSTFLGHIFVCNSLYFVYFCKKNFSEFRHKKDIIDIYAVHLENLLL